MPAKKTRRSTAKKSAAAPATYRVLIGFQYPADANVRRRIKASHDSSGGDPVPLDECGEIIYRAIGNTFERNEVPEEVFAACEQRAGAIEPVGAKAEPEAPNGEEATSDDT